MKKLTKRQRNAVLKRILKGVWGASPWNMNRMITGAIEVIEGLYKEEKHSGVAKR